MSLSPLPLRPRFVEALEARHTLHRLDQATDRDAVLGRAEPVCTAMVVDGHVTVDAALRLPVCSSVGFDRIDLPAMTRRGVTLTNTSAALADDVADAAIPLIWHPAAGWSRPMPMSGPATGGGRACSR